MTPPIVSVLMPVYNGIKYLNESVQSILSQSLSDLELLIIDDGSTDGSFALIERFEDPRVRLLSNSRNMGLVHTLNLGIDLARGEFIARMDADDIALRGRLERQVEYLRARPNIGVLGCWSKTVTNHGSWETRYPVDHESICAHMLFNTALSHPSVMFRGDMIRNAPLRYDELAEHAEDYLLWVRLSDFVDLGNLPEVQFIYRHHNAQTSALHKDAQEVGADLARREMLRYFGIEPTKEQWEIHRKIARLDLSGPHEKAAAFRWLDHVATKARKKSQTSSEALIMECQRRKQLVRRQTSFVRSLVRRAMRPAPDE